MQLHRLIEALRDVCYLPLAILGKRTDRTLISLSAVKKVDQLDAVVRVRIPG